MKSLALCTLTTSGLVPERVHQNGPGRVQVASGLLRDGIKAGKAPVTSPKSLWCARGVLGRRAGKPQTVRAHLCVPSTQKPSVKAVSCRDEKPRALSTVTTNRKRVKFWGSGSEASPLFLFRVSTGEPMSTRSQRLAIGRYLKSGKKLTALDALRRFGTWRLSGRIYELRRGGLAIKTELVKRGEKRIAEYRAA